MNAALFQAVESGDLARVESLFLPPEVDALDQHGSTPLLKAIENGQKPIIECLLAHGAAVNGPVGAVETPLQQACFVGNSDIVSLLLEHGADVDALGADMDAFDIGTTPLTIACGSKTKLSIVQLLINAGADVNGGDGWIAPLHRAIYNENKAAFDLLIQSGADVNILSRARHDDAPAGSTPLHFATFKDNSDCITTLLAAGADPNIANDWDEVPLHIAASHRSNDVVNALLAAGGDPLHRDDQGRTPLQELYVETHNFSAEDFNIITALVAAGDRPWECLPTPCPGLEAAMLSVWQAAPDEMPELVKRMENPPQNLIELFPRMSEEMKKVVQEVLRGLHRHFAGYPEVQELCLKAAFIGV